ncbi:MAG: hypothetical protein ACO1OY_10640 [Ramlibacter sp.]
MRPLPSELQRLYLPTAAADAADSHPPAGLVGVDDSVRAMVLELTRTPDWEPLARVWQGTQAELGLPAPAIAVSGTDALQLWFAVDEPVGAAQAWRFLEGLRLRFLADVDGRRLRLFPTGDVSAPRHTRLVPAQQDDGNWSAFVAPDLAPVFGETPWLDIPPSEDGQASLLRGIAPMKRAAFDAALQQLALAGHAHEPAAASLAALAAPAAPAVPVTAHVTAPVAAPASAARAGNAAGDPAAFLRRVMDDESVPLPLRIDAAKALLQHSGG